MSVDLEAYFVRRPGAAVARGTQAGAGWVLNVEDAVRVEPEDLAPDLAPYLGRCRWRIDIHLEGAAAGAGGAAMRALAERLIRRDGARLHDPQAGTVAAREGTQPVVATRDLPAADSGFKLAVLFERADRIDRGRMEQLLDLIQAELPEALPHRYGQAEPPQGRWAQGGKDAFLAAWDPLDPPFWIGKAPACYAYSSFHHPVAPRPAFRAGRLEIQFRPSLTGDPSRLLAACRLAEQAALCLDAFYAALVPDGNDHGPWWKGLYPAPHLALVLGPPLLACWPEYERLSRPLGPRHRAAGLRHGRAPLAPPEALCFPLEPIEPELLPLSKGRTHRPANLYAPVFPFAKADPYS